MSVLVPVGGEGGGEGAGGAGVGGAGGAGGERAGGEGGGLEEVPVLVAAVCPHSNMLRAHLARLVVADSLRTKKLPILVSPPLQLLRANFVLVGLQILA